MSDSTYGRVNLSKFKLTSPSVGYPHKGGSIYTLKNQKKKYEIFGIKFVISKKSALLFLFSFLLNRNFSKRKLAI